MYTRLARNIDRLSSLIEKEETLHGIQSGSPVIVAQRQQDNIAKKPPVISVCMAITYSKGKDHEGKVANPARGQLNRENEYFPVPIRA